MGPETHLFDGRTREQINQLYLMYYWARKLTYTTRDESNIDNRGLLWSSSFIQAYYACETLCSIDWQATLNKSGMEVWDQESVESRNPTEALKAMLQFCYDLLGSDAPLKFNQLFTDEIKSLDDPVAILNDISADMYYFKEQQNFRSRFEQIRRVADLTPDEHRDLVFRMVRFVYSVRDNVFHGYTLAIMMTQNVSLQMRLQIYSGLLLAVCELLFEVLEQKSNWQPEITKFDRPQYDHYLEAIEASRFRNKGRVNILNAWRN